jgi:predicted N-acetyltransferase YhbS
MTPAVTIRPQTAEDLTTLSALHEEAFGPGRFARTAYRVREGTRTEPRLNLCALEEGKLIGAIQFTPITIGGREGALLLGPLVIADSHKNLGWGLKLMLEGLARARALGYRVVILVGDLPYYARAGFVRVPFGRVQMPGPVNDARLLYAELEQGAFADYTGEVRGIPLSDRLPGEGEFHADRNEKSAKNALNLGFEAREEASL